MLDSPASPGFLVGKFSLSTALKVGGKRQSDTSFSLAVHEKIQAAASRPSELIDLASDSCLQVQTVLGEIWEG